MWMHVDSADYGAAKLGVAVSDTPAGPFKFLRAFRPNNNQESRDMTIFVDEVGRPSKKDKGKIEGKGDAYVAYSSEMNKVLHISRLTGKKKRERERERKRRRRGEREFELEMKVGFFCARKGRKNSLFFFLSQLPFSQKNRRLPRLGPDLQEEQLHARGGECFGKEEEESA
jgi:hypothetical protein